MTLMAAEAGEGAAVSEAGDATVAGRRATRSPSGTAPPPVRATPGGGRRPGPAGGQRGPMSRSTARPRSGGRTQQGSQPESRALAGKVVSKAGPQGKAASKAAGFKPTGNRRRPRSLREQQIRAGGRRAAKFATSTNYRSVIVGELLLAILLVAATPFSRKNTGSVSPYSGQDLLQLLAITLLYFILAVVAGTTQTAARFAAWFGGLILLAIGLGETSALVNTLAIFGGSNANPPAQTTAATTGTLPNTSQVNPGSQAPPSTPSTSADTGITSRGDQQDIVTPPSASGSGNG